MKVISGFKSSYVCEIFLLSLILISGVQSIDNFTAYQLEKKELALKSNLHNKAVELSVETLSAMSTATYHYDKYAQKQLGFERLLGASIELESTGQTFKNAMYEFLNSVTDYMQFATMLKTSFRFVASMALNTEEAVIESGKDFNNIAS